MFTGYIHYHSTLHLHPGLGFRTFSHMLSVSVPETRGQPQYSAHTKNPLTARYPLLLGGDRHSPGAGFTKPPLERTSFSKGRSFLFLCEGHLKIQFHKAPLTLLTKGLPGNLRREQMLFVIRYAKKLFNIPLNLR